MEGAAFSTAGGAPRGRQRRQQSQSRWAQGLGRRGVRQRRGGGSSQERHRLFRADSQQRTAPALHELAATTRSTRCPDRYTGGAKGLVSRQVAAVQARNVERKQRLVAPRLITVAKIYAMPSQP